MKPGQSAFTGLGGTEFPRFEAAETDIIEEKPSRLDSKLVMFLFQCGLLSLFLIAWQLASGTLLREFYVSKPSIILERLWGWIVSGDLWHHLEATLLETLLGFIFGALAGFVAGLLLGRSPFLARLLTPFLTAINALPKVALAPLFILWCGIGLPMKVVLSITIVFFLVFYNTFTGVLSVDEDLINIVRTMGAKRRHILFKVAVPSALLWVFTGLRISIPYALIGAVVGEIFASNEGIGFLINSSASQFDTAGVFAGLLVLTALATGFSSLLSWFERKVLRS
jgi:NitT/TauT family transport system permease protein